ncbi:MAG: response regulator transcription factor [Bacteroidota bacterium]|nr:response regulator transcription factor [Bacteroidota bacterium]
MKHLIRVMLVDDHQIIIDGIANMVRDAEGVVVCCTAPDAAVAMEMIPVHHPDIIITDLSLPGKSGIELIRQITDKFPEVNTLVLSMYSTEDYIFNSIRAGAKGYLLKQDTTKAELLKAIRIISEGSQYFSDQVAQVMARMYSHHARSSTSGNSLPKQVNLTGRETEILRLYAHGLSNQEIADSLNISIRTVETHKNNIMQKYNFKSTVDMVKFAIRNKLTDL